MTTIALHPTAGSVTVGRPVRVAQEQTVRLTRRGRIVVGTLIALPIIIAAYLLGFGASQAGADSTPSHVAFEHVTVMPGESLWTIAGQVAPGADRQEVVAAIVSLNQLDGATVHPGENLAIPTRYSK